MFSSFAFHWCVTLTLFDSIFLVKRAKNETLSVGRNENEQSQMCPMNERKSIKERRWNIKWENILTRSHWYSLVHRSQWTLHGYTNTFFYMGRLKQNSKSSNFQQPLYWLFRGEKKNATTLCGMVRGRMWKENMKRMVRFWHHTWVYTDEHENIFLIKISKYFYKFMGCFAVWGWMGERYGT